MVRAIVKSKLGKFYQEMFDTQTALENFCGNLEWKIMKIESGKDFSVVDYDGTDGVDIVLETQDDTQTEILTRQVETQPEVNEDVVEEQVKSTPKRARKVSKPRKSAPKTDDDKAFKKLKTEFKEQYFIQNPKSGTKLNKEESEAWYKAESDFIISHGRVPVYYLSMKYKKELKDFRTKFSTQNSSASNQEKERAEEQFLKTFM